MALSFVLLTATVLLIFSVRQIQNASPGFAVGNLLTSSIDFLDAGYNGPRMVDAEDELAVRMRRAPGVQAVAFARSRPFTTETRKSFFYVPLRQGKRGLMVFVRAALPPEALARLLVRETHRLDANLVPGEVVSMRMQVDRVIWTQRAALKLLAIFGGLALLLGAVGLYGVMSYSVSQGKRELGLRMALGARGSDLLRIVISEGMLLTALGVAVGAGAAIALTRLLGDLLYKTSARDPKAFGIALAVIAVSSLAACLVPAHRASRTDPVRALRGTD